MFRSFLLLLIISIVDAGTKSVGRSHNKNKNIIYYSAYTFITFGSLFYISRLRKSRSDYVESINKDRIINKLNELKSFSNNQIDFFNTFPNIFNFFSNKIIKHRLDIQIYDQLILLYESLDINKVDEIKVYIRSLLQRVYRDRNITPLVNFVNNNNHMIRDRKLHKKVSSYVYDDVSTIVSDYCVDNNIIYEI